MIGSLCSFGLAKLRVRYKTIILGFVLSASMFPPVATVSPLFIVIRAIGLRDTWFALIITYTTFSLPLSIWILTSFFRESRTRSFTLPIDGCNSFQSYLKIILPLSAPGIFATAILVFIFSWNEFLYALTFTSTTASAPFLWRLPSFPAFMNSVGEISAASVIVTIPLVVLIFAFQKRIIEGLTAGAVKG